MSVKILRRVNENEVEVIAFSKERQDIDAIISEQLTFSATVSEHALEDGSVIADHVIQAPDELSMTGWVSDYPITRLSGGFGLLPERDDERSKSVFYTLRDIFRKRDRVVIVDDLAVHGNMVMTDLQIPMEKDTHHGLRFTATFRQVRLVDTIEVQINATDAPLAKPAADQGVTTPDLPTPEVEAEAESWAFSIFGAS